MLIKFNQSIGSIPDAGVRDRGKPNVYAHSYPGRKIARVKVEDAVSDPAIVQSAREAYFTSTHTALKDSEAYEDLSDEKRNRDRRYSTSYHGVGLQPRSGRSHESQPQQNS